MHVAAEQADHLRTARRQAATTAANKTPVKLVFPILFCMAPAALLLLLGLAPLSRRLQPRLARWSGGITTLGAPALDALVLAWLGIGVLWLLLLGAAPWLVSRREDEAVGRTAETSTHSTISSTMM